MVRLVVATLFVFTLGLLLAPRLLVALLLVARFVALALFALLLLAALLLLLVLLVLLVALACFTFTCFALANFALALALIGVAIAIALTLARFLGALTFALLLLPAAPVVFMAEIRRLCRIGRVGLRVRLRIATRAVDAAGWVDGGRVVIAVVLRGNAAAGEQTGSAQRQQAGSGNFEHGVASYKK